MYTWELAIDFDCGHSECLTWNVDFPLSAMKRVEKGWHATGCSHCVVAS